MLKKLKKDINGEMGSFLKDLKRLMPTGDISGALYRGIEDFVLRDGKRIRPVLFLISYLGYTKKKKISRGPLLRCALSLELLHDFLLVHDDVIDRSDLRRGKPTLHRFYNNSFGARDKAPFGADLAIVAGDIMFALATEALLAVDEVPDRKEKALRTFSRTAMNTGIGEFIDVVNNMKGIESVSEKDILMTYAFKTAKYTFESPLLLGSILAGSGDSEAGKIPDLGMSLGQAFQLQDDLLDVFSSTKKTGKPVLSDLNESKKTLLVWKAYRALKGPGKKKLKRLLEKASKSRGDLLAIRDLIRDSGAGVYCFGKVRDLFEDADSLCSGLKMKKEYLSELKRFIETLSQRSELIDI